MPNAPGAAEPSTQHAVARAGGLRARTQGWAASQPLLLVFLGMFMQSIGPVFVQASSASGPVFSFWRLWLGVPFLAVATVVHVRMGGRWPDLRAWRWPLWAGLAFAASQVLFFSALKATSVADVSLVTTLAPLITAVAAARLFGERPGARFRLWTVVAMAGAAIVVVGASAGPQGSPAGMAMALAAIICFTTFFLISKLARDSIDVLPFLLGVMTFGALAVTLFSLATRQPVAAMQGRDLLLALFVAVVPGAVGHFVSTWPLRHVPANVPPVVRLGQPVISGLLAWWWLSEPITSTHLLGGLLTLGGVCGAVLSRSGRRFAAGSSQGVGERPPPAPVPERAG